MKIVFYVSQSGKHPVLEEINDLSVEDQARIFGCLKSVEELGFECPRVAFRQIEGKLWEIKIKLQSGGFRIFYVVMQGDLMVLLHAYKKKSQKAPSNELKTATKRLKEVINNETDYLG